LMDVPVIEVAMDVPVIAVAMDVAADIHRVRVAGAAFAIFGESSVGYSKRAAGERESGDCEGEDEFRGHVRPCLFFLRRLPRG
jgi:hypothetical protein